MMSLATLPPAELAAREGPVVGARTIVLTKEEQQKLRDGKKCYTPPNASLCRKDKQLCGAMHTVAVGQGRRLVLLDFCEWVEFPEDGFNVKAGTRFAKWQMPTGRQ